jgi:hypothetical protein
VTFRLRLTGDTASPDGRWLRLVRDTLLSMLVELSVVEQRYQAILAVIRVREMIDRRGARRATGATLFRCDDPERKRRLDEPS